MYKIKQIPEDFVVEEMIEPILSENGSFVIYELKKKGISTIKAASKIVRFIGSKQGDFGYAGVKDSYAVTTQLISLPKRYESRLSKFDSDNMSFEKKGYSDSPLCLGDNKGNRFIITVRNIIEEPKKIDHFPNYFGEQRFGRNNLKVGIALLKKEFKIAADMIKEAIENPNSYEKSFQEYYEKNPNDPICAIRLIPKKVLLLYIHSVQSHIFNELLKNIKDDLEKDSELPLVGFDFSPMDDYFSECNAVMKKLGVTSRDFIIPQLDRVACDLSQRKAFCKISNLKIGQMEDDDMNKENKKVTVAFELSKGSYATEAVREMFS